jgi:hypothetical protein
MKRICEWCGKPITVLRHGNQHYHKINDDGIECYKEHRREVIREARSKNYRKNRERENLKSTGSGYLREHRKQDFTSEYETIQKELNRLGIRKIVFTGNSEEELIQPLRN